MQTAAMRTARKTAASFVLSCFIVSFLRLQDGEDLVREIRSDPALKDLKVFAVTADVERQKDYAGMGFTGILMKPITFETLKSALA